MIIRREGIQTRVRNDVKNYPSFRRYFEKSKIARNCRKVSFRKTEYCSGKLVEYIEKKGVEGSIHGSLYATR